MRIILGTQNGTVILITTHIDYSWLPISALQVNMLLSFDDKGNDLKATITRKLQSLSHLLGMVVVVVVVVAVVVAIAVEVAAEVEVAVTSLA